MIRVRPPRRLAVAGAIALAMAMTGTTHAGTGSEAAPAGRFTVEDSAGFSKQIERDLAARGARLALVFRAGQPRENLPDGVRYTHGAIWVHSQLETADGRQIHGYAVHNLYHREDNRRRSELVQDWPLNFTLGDVEGEVGVIIPSPEMQARLVRLLAGGGGDRLHQPDYSLISNPFDLRFQNCTEYLLDLVAAAAWETTDRAQIKANLRAHFQPAGIDAGPLGRLFGPLADERVRLDDHRGAIRTTTYASLAGFMERYGLLTEAYEIRAEFLERTGETG